MNNNVKDSDLKPLKKPLYPHTPTKVQIVYDQSSGKNRFITDIEFELFADSIFRFYLTCFSATFILFFYIIILNRKQRMKECHMVTNILFPLFV